MVVNMIYIYNSFSRSIEELRTINKKKVGLYTCGPTVYSELHIGHARTFIFFDIFKRFLIKKGYSILHVQNFTDIDEKITRVAKNKKINERQLTEFIINEYHKDMEKLKIFKPDIEPLTSEYIQEIDKAINEMKNKSLLYKNGMDLFFDLSKIPNFITKIKYILDKSFPEELEKNNEMQNFIIWRYDDCSPYHIASGKGVPGWHVECYAMVNKNLGIPFDIQGGGTDLIYPHHIYEDAISIGIKDTEFARYYMHVAHLQFENRKMSKSDVNIIYLKDLLNKYGPDVVRLYLEASIHYREILSFSDKDITDMAIRIKSIKDKIKTIMEEKGGSSSIKMEILKNFYGKLEYDIDIPSAFTEFEQNIDLCLKNGVADIDKFKKEVEDISFILGVDFI
jgi:cysteinyl-tRNA synthetase